MLNCDLYIKIPLALFKNQNEIVKVTLKDISFYLPFISYL